MLVNPREMRARDLFCRLRLTLSRAAQDTFHRVIGFMAGVFVDRTLTLRHRNRYRPSFVHVDGSSTVNSYRSVFSPARVKRSIRCVFALEPSRLVSRLKLTVSTTSVLPSQCPRESPLH